MEFGTSFGVSTLYLAAAVRDAGAGGKVIGTEIVPAKAESARRALAEAGLAEHVEIREGGARKTLAELDVPVDFLLLDGWPQLADEILMLVVARLSTPPFRATRLPLNGATLVGVLDG